MGGQQNRHGFAGSIGDRCIVARIGTHENLHRGEIAFVASLLHQYLVRHTAWLAEDRQQGGPGSALALHPPRATSIARVQDRTQRSYRPATVLIEKSKTAQRRRAVSAQ